MIDPRYQHFIQARYTVVLRLPEKPRNKKELNRHVELRRFTIEQNPLRCLTMDPRRSAQDVLRCHFCENPAPPLYCEICHTHMCKACVGEHFMDEFTSHRIILFEKRGYTPICTKHLAKLCELNCENCDIPVCSHCVSSGEHIGHKLIDFTLKSIENKKEIQKDINELENSIYPEYQKFLSNITIQKSDLNRNSKKLTNAINKHGENMHRVIDSIIEKLKSDLDEADSKNMAILDKQDEEITCTISEILQIIAELKVLMNSDDIRIVSAFKSKNAELRRLPPKLTVSLPCFTPQKINEEQILQKFGSLSRTGKSDPNTSTKIAERFSVLFDNERTDAGEKLMDKCKMSEEDAIQTLLQIMEDSYKYCRDISTKRYTNILAELTLLKLTSPNETASLNTAQVNRTQKEKNTLKEIKTFYESLNSPNSSVSDDNVDLILTKFGLNMTNLKNIKEMLNSSHERTGFLVYESFYRQLNVDPKWRKDVLESIEPFLKECVRICWLMMAKDPPMYLKPSEERGSKVNKDIYRLFKWSGEEVELVVWPALFLHENGPLLCKGVVKPMEKK